MNTELADRISVEWIVLGDYAEVSNGKLTLVGGGWDTLVVQPGSSAPHALSLAVAFRVPWAETNRLHQVEIEVQNDDGAPLARVDGQFEVGRPAGLPVGHMQRFQMALNHAQLSFEKDGTHEIVVRIDGQADIRGRSAFQVVGMSQHESRQR